MDKENLIAKVKYLISKNKTQEALKLLSSAQLSENDKTVVLLMGQLTTLQDNAILNKISTEELNRMQAAINESILNFSENIDQEEINSKKLIQNSPPIIQPSETPTIEPNPVVNNSALNNTRATDSSSDLFKNKKLLTIIPIALLVISFFVYRVSSTPPISTTNPSTTTPNTTPNNDKQSHKAPVDVENKITWANNSAIYFEDFSNRKKSGFRNDIWKLENKSDDFWTGVMDDAYYLIDIKNEKKIPSRHKYIGRISYNSNFDVNPYYVKIRLDPDAKCQTKNECLGRGLTVRYDNKKKSTYAFVIDDQYNVSFVKLDDFKKPNAGKVIFSQKVTDLKSNSVELGIACLEDKFWLYFDRKLIKTVTDNNALSGKYNGIIASGKGKHMFEEVYLGQEIE